MHDSQDFLARWLIKPAQFERWVNVLAENDDGPPSPCLCLLPQEIPAVSWLSFY
jgi:hypothetical protein